MKPVAKSFRAIQVGQRVYVQAPNLVGVYPVVGKTKRKIIVETPDGRMAKVGPEVVLIARSEKSRRLLEQMVGGVQMQNPVDESPFHENPPRKKKPFAPGPGWFPLMVYEPGFQTKFESPSLQQSYRIYHDGKLVGQVDDEGSMVELVNQRFGYPAKIERRKGGLVVWIAPMGNPSDDAVEAGVREYENFHWGEPPNFVAEIEPPVPKGTIHGIGELVGVIYKTKKGKRGKKSDQYIHHFKKQRPVLAYDEEGKLVVVGGDYSIEDRGIVD